MAGYGEDKDEDDDNLGRMRMRTREARMKWRREWAGVSLLSLRTTRSGKCAHGMPSCAKNLLKRLIKPRTRGKHCSALSSTAHHWSIIRGPLLVPPSRSRSFPGAQVPLRLGAPSHTCTVYLLGTVDLSHYIPHNRLTVKLLQSTELTDLTTQYLDFVSSSSLVRDNKIDLVNHLIEHVL